MKIYPVPTGNFKLDGGAMFGVVPKSIWQKLYPADDKNLCNWSMRCLLIEDGDRKILINNGIGNKQDEKFFRHFYLNGDDSLEKSLARYGFSTDDITDMLLTHLHFDHCGGSIKINESGKPVPAFKNARYWVSKGQWEWATNPNNREKASFLKENILPIKENGKLNLIEKEGQIFKNVNIRFFSGHTENQAIPFINYKGKTVVFMSDLLPSTAHIPLPYVMAYDTRPLLTLKEKEAFFNEAIENNYLLFFEHDIYNECCTLKMTEKGARVDETYTLKEYFGNS